MSTYSYRCSKNNDKLYPAVIESEPPTFPRPSSSIARSRLKNRLISKNSTAVNHKLLPVPPNSDRDDEFRHQVRHDHDSHVHQDNDVSVYSRPNGGSIDIQSHLHSQQDSVADSHYFVQLGSTDVVESFAMGGGNESCAVYPSRDVNTRHLHSRIIPSHSLYVPGYESTVPRPPAAQASQHNSVDPSVLILSTAYGKSFQSDTMEDAVELILSGQKEFCYLNEVDPDDQYRLVLNFNNISKDTCPGRYTTLSANGVVRYYDGGMDSVSLKEYLREYKYYYRLRTIPVIGQYRLWKSFLILKTYVLETRRKKVVAVLHPSLFILDELFRDMLLYVNISASCLHDREASRLTKVLSQITTPNYFEVQDTLAQNRIPITKEDLAPKNFAIDSVHRNEKGSGGEKCSSLDPVKITKDMSKEEVLFHVASCVNLKCSCRVGHIVKDLIPQSLLESNFRHQSSIDMIATRESNRTKSFVFEKAAKKNMLEKARQAAQGDNKNSPILGGGVLDKLLNEELVVSVEEDNISYTQRSANRLNCRRIANSVRIVDFILRDYLYVAAESCLSSFLLKFEKLRRGDVSSGDIGIKMVIRDLRKVDDSKERSRLLDDNNDNDHDVEEEEEDSNLLSLYGIDTALPPPSKSDLAVEMYPNKAKALKSLHNLVTEVFNACRHETSLLHHSQLKDIFRPIANELIDCSILDLIYYDEQNSVHNLANQMVYILEKDLAKCERTLRHYDFLLETYCRTCNEANALTVDILCHWSIDQIAKKLTDIDKEIEEVTSIPASVSIGIATLHVSDVVRDVLGQLHHVKQVYQKKIPQLFVLLGEKLYQKAHKVKVKLVKKHTLVKEYVSAIEVYNAAVINVPHMEKEFEYLTGLKHVMGVHKGITATDVMYSIDTTLKTEYHKYQESLTAFEEAAEENSKFFQKELLLRSKKIVLPIQEIELSLASELFSSNNSNADDVFQELARLELKFNDACAESAYLVKAQYLMKFFVFDGLQADRIQLQLTTNRILWKAISMIRKIVLYTMSTRFQDIACLSVQETVQAISRTLSKLESHDFSPAEVWMADSIALLESLLPVVVHLKCDSFTKAETTEIETLVGQKIYSSGDWSGQKLLNLNILDFSSNIVAIYHRNVCESHLQKKLADMQTRLDKKEVQISQDRDISYRITNLVECSEFLEDLVITTKVCLQSKYVKNIKDDFLLFYEKVQRYDQLVKWILEFQKEGLRLRSFYTNAKITRHVHQGFKHFNVVDESWRSLIKLGRSDYLLLSLLSSSRLKNLDIINNAVTIAFDVIYMYLESQRVNAPRLYYLSDTQCFDMFSNSDIKTVFDLAGSTLFPNLTAITLGTEGDNVFVEGVTSGTETIRFKSVCPLQVVLGDWINDIDKALTEHVIHDIITLVTGERSIIEDARYPICTNQAKIVGLEVKFWASMKECFQSAVTKKARSESLKSQKASILDNIVILGTISSISNHSYQVQSVANLIICLIQQRDLFDKAFGDGSENHFDNNAFFLECAIQKIFDSKTSEISVRHFTTELSYGYKYLGFSQSSGSLTISPLTEKCYLAISATFHKSSQQIPFLRGSGNGTQLETLKSITSVFGVEMFSVDCASLSPNTSESGIKRLITGSVGGRFHTCFTNIQALSASAYSFLITSLCSTMIKLSEAPKEKATKTKFDLLQAIHLSKSPHFSLCLSLNHTSEATYFPASIRKNFRLVHIISPRFSEVLAMYLEAYGFESPAMACIRLSGFLDHVSKICAIDHNLLLKILIQDAIPSVGNSLVKTSTVDTSEQCYRVVTRLFKHIPSHMQEFLTLRNLQYACSFYLNYYMDPVTNVGDFKEDFMNNHLDCCDRLVSALVGNKRCAIVIGAVGGGKTTIIREAVGRIEGFGSKAPLGNKAGRGSATDPDFETMEDSVTGTGDGNVNGSESSAAMARLRTSSSMSSSSTFAKSAKPALQSRNGQYRADESYPKKLFRHSINPVLFHKVEMDSNVVVADKTPWSGVSTSLSKEATKDLRRKSIISMQETGEETTKINNRRHFDSLDRFLYDISSSEDVSYLHMEVADSSVLSHFMNRLTHNCPNKYSPSLISMGYNLIWECSEISQIDPRLASSVPIVFIPESHYTPNDTLVLQMQFFMNKFDYQPTNDERYDDVTTPLMSCLSKCVDLFVRPFLVPSAFESLHAVQSVHVVLRSYFEVAAAMYNYVGLDVATLIHPREVTVIYDSSHEESSVVEKSFWNQASFFSVMAFACIFSFGNCSPSSQQPFEIIYNQIQENVMAEMSSWVTDDVKLTEGSAQVLPPTSTPDVECAPCYEYCLHRVDNEGVEVKWVHWKLFTALAQLTPKGFDNNAHIKRNTKSFYCTVNDYFIETGLIPTHSSLVLSQLKEALMLNKQACSDSVGTTFSALSIIGRGGVGKSSLLFMLANGMDDRKQWKGLIIDTSPQSVMNAIQESKNAFHCYLLENEFPFVGALFLDDVNLEADRALDVENGGAELYRRMFNGDYHYNVVQRKWIRYENILYALSGSIRDKSINQRLLQHCIAFSVPESPNAMAQIFMSKFRAICPNVKEDVAYDIANITVNVFEKFKQSASNDVDLLPMITTCPSSARVKFVLAGISKVLEKVSVVTTLEVCRHWRNIVSSMTNGSADDKIFQGLLNSYIDNTARHKSNIKGIIYKGQVDGVGDSVKKSMNFRATNRSSLRPTLKHMSHHVDPSRPQDQTQNDNADATVNVVVGGGGSPNSVITMSPEELMLAYLPQMEEVVLKNFQLVDFESLLLWNDIQKCVSFLTVGNAPFALFWGPAKPVLNVVIESSCTIAKWNFLSFNMDGTRSFQEFTLQFVNSFCSFLLLTHEQDLKLGTKCVEAVRRVGGETPVERGMTIIPDSISSLWHLHLNDIDQEITSCFWTRVLEVIYFKAEDVHTLLNDVYDISFSRHIPLRQYFLHFLSHVKIVFSFGAHAVVTTAIKELSFVPKLNNVMLNVHFSKIHHMNTSLLLNSFEDMTVVNHLSRAVTHVVSAVCGHDAMDTKNNLYLELCQTEQYEEGTYGMISRMFQLSVDPSSRGAWDRHTADFAKLLHLKQKNAVKTVLQSGSVDNDEDNGEDEASGGERGNEAASGKVKLANIVWACVSTRYFTMSCASDRSDLEASVWATMMSNDLIPTDRDIEIVAYAYLHALVETGCVSVSSAFVDMFDTILLSGDCIPSTKVEFCGLLLALLSEGSVRVVGDAHDAVFYLADLCGFNVRASHFKMHRCDSYDLEDFVTMSADRTKVNYSEDQSRNSTHVFIESIVSFAKTDKCKPTSQRTTVMVFNSQSTVCVDTFILFFLVKGFTQNQQLHDSFIFFHQAAKALNAVSNESRSEAFNNIICLENSVLFTSQSESLRSQWHIASSSINSFCLAFSALSTSVASFQANVYKVIPDQMLAFLSNIAVEKKSCPLNQILHDLLGYLYTSLSERLNESALLVLKMNMVVCLSERNLRISSSIVRQMFHLVKKRFGLLGLHSSPTFNDDIVPTNDSFDIMNIAFEHLNKVNRRGGRERLTMDNLLNLFLTNTESFEEWANMYSLDHVIPIPDEELDEMSYIEKILIVALLKPVSLDDVVLDFIYELTTWKIDDVESSEFSELREEQVTIILCENPSGVFDLSSSTAAPYFFTKEDMDTDQVGLSSGTDSPRHNTMRYEHVVLFPELGNNVEIIVEYLINKRPKPVTLTVESKSLGHVNATHIQHGGSNVLIKKTNVPSLLWYQYPILLKNSLECLMIFHGGYSSGLPVKSAIPPLLVRVYWLLALFHVSVVVRLYPFDTTVGDDLLRVAARMLTQLRLRSVYEPEFMFSKLEKLVVQVYHQVYCVTSDSTYVKSIVRALFENVFTSEATDPDKDYYLLGLLPIPGTLDQLNVDTFVTNITDVLCGADCIHVADFIGCTNGELYEVHIKDITLTALQGATANTPATLRACGGMTRYHHMLGGDISTKVPQLLPQLCNHHYRIVPAVTFLLAQLPPPIKVDEEQDAINLRKLCTSKFETGKKKVSVVGGFSLNENSITSEQPSTRRAKGGAGAPPDRENHLWFYLQLEIACYNSSLVQLQSALNAMLDCQACPSDMFNIIEDLEQNNVPASWLKYSFDENKSTIVSLDEWMRQLNLRRKMLNVWLVQRYPEYIYLHLLHNPEGFIFALKQCFAAFQQISFEDVMIDARILQLPFTSVERHSEIAKIHAGNSRVNMESFSVVVAGAHMMNARWLEEHYNLEFLNPSFASKFSQELYLKVSATCAEPADEEDYQCPFYTASDFPTADSIVTPGNNACSMLWTRNREPLFNVSIPSHCPVVEWQKRNVTIHASPEWHVPDA